MTYPNIKISDTWSGNVKKGKPEQNTYKVTWNYQRAGPLLLSRIGSRGLTSKLEGEHENKPEIIAGKKTQGLKVLLREALGKVEDLEQEMISLLSRENLTKEKECPKSGTNTSKRHSDTTEDFKNTKKLKLVIENGNPKSMYSGENQEQANLEHVWNWHQTPTGKQETNGGTATKDTKMSYWTTFTDGSPGTYYCESLIDTHWTSMQKEVEDDSWLNEYL